MTELISMLENRIKDCRLRFNLVELVKVSTKHLIGFMDYGFCQDSKWDVTTNFVCLHLMVNSVGKSCPHTTTLM